MHIQLCLRFLMSYLNQQSRFIFRDIQFGGYIQTLAALFLISLTENPSRFEFKRWRSQRITQLTTNLTRHTRTASKSQRGTVTLPPKGWILSFSGTRGMQGSTTTKMGKSPPKKSKLSF
uniref:Uncharacterized protein LOC101505550 isoform X1 n=2 Tax=Cicer arietinum TaxID=3827 RepID=A0A1S3E7P5_CICAR|nr:uncharacterized protein LOC101505550 isoform X1 [Cicer arietinum]